MPRCSRLPLPQFAADLVEIAGEVLERKLAASGDIAQQVALEIARQVLMRNAKSEVYVPEEKVIDREIRDVAIWDGYRCVTLPGSDSPAFSAARVRVLAEKHNLTWVSIYQIIRKRRASWSADASAAVAMTAVGTDRHSPSEVS